MNNNHQSNEMPTEKTASVIMDFKLTSCTFIAGMHLSLMK